MSVLKVKSKETTNTVSTEASTGQSQTGDVQGVSQNLTGITLASGANLSLLDQGAIGGALDVVKQVLGFAEDTSQRSGDLYHDLSDRVAKTTDQVAGAFTSSKELQGAVNAQQLMLAALGAAVLIVGFIVFRKRG